MPNCYYGKKPEFNTAPNANPPVVRQLGWAPYSFADGSQLLHAESRDGQLVVVRGAAAGAHTANPAILWSAVLDVRSEGIQFVTAVEQIANSLPVELKVTYKPRQNARGSGNTVTVPLNSLLAAAAAGEEVVHV